MGGSDAGGGNPHQPVPPPSFPPFDFGQSVRARGLAPVLPSEVFAAGAGRRSTQWWVGKEEWGSGCNHRMYNTGWAYVRKSLPLIPIHDAGCS